MAARACRMKSRVRLSSGIEPCSPPSHGGALPGKLKTTWAVRTGFEPVSTDPDSVMLCRYTNELIVNIKSMKKPGLQDRARIQRLTCLSNPVYRSFDIVFFIYSIGVLKAGHMPRTTLEENAFFQACKSVM